MKKLVFLDIDGTLLGFNQSVPQSAIAACKAARKRGHLLYICSGRALAEITPMILNIGFDGIVSGGGARIAAEGQIIFQACLDRDFVRRIARFMNVHQKPCIFELGDHLVANPYFVPYMEKLRSLLDANGERNDGSVDERTEILEPDAEFQSDGVEKIVFAGETPSFEEINATFGKECELFRGSIPAFGASCGEISPPGIHKGNALEIVARHYGMPISETIAIGDSDNDREMIARAGIGIAMGNAVEPLKKIARFVTTRLENDGIAYAFQKYGLI